MHSYPASSRQPLETISSTAWRRFASPRMPSPLGIRVVHQRPLLAGPPSSKISFLGSRGSSFDRPRARARIQSLASKWNAPLDPTTVSELGPRRASSPFLEAVSREPGCSSSRADRVLGPKARDASLGASLIGASIVLVPTISRRPPAGLPGYRHPQRTGYLEADRAQGFSAVDLEKAMFPPTLTSSAARGAGTGQVALAVNELGASPRGSTPTTRSVTPYARDHASPLRARAGGLIP
jgi:hypothetical protein